MNKAVRLVLGIGTILAYLTLVFFLISLLLFFVGIVSISDSPRGGPGPAFVLGFVLFYVAVIALALLSSGLTMGYSFHMAWNEAISPKARGWWTVALWLGSILVMPFYWFKHLMHDPEPVEETHPPTPPMSRQNAMTLGIMTVVPFVLMALGFVFFALFFGIAMVDLDSPRASGASVIGSLALMAVAYIILFGSLILVSVLMFVYGYINAANSRIQPTYRGVWAIGMLLMPYFVIPAYWFVEVWQPATQPLLPTGVDLAKDSPVDPSNTDRSAATETATVGTTTAVGSAAATSNEASITKVGEEANDAAVPTTTAEDTGVTEPAPTADSVPDAPVASESPAAPADPPTMPASSLSTEHFPADPGEAPRVVPEHFPRDPGDAPPASTEQGKAIPLPPAQPTDPDSESSTEPGIDPTPKPDSPAEPGIESTPKPDSPSLDK